MPDRRGRFFLSQTVAGPAEASVSTLRQLELRRLGAMRHNNAPALMSLLAPGMTYIHESGKCYDRDDYVRAIESHALTYDEDVDLAEEHVKLWPEVMISLGIMHGHARLEGERQVFNLRYTATWIRSDESWRLTLVQKTPILPGVHA